LHRLIDDTHAAAADFADDAEIAQPAAFGELLLDGRFLNGRNRFSQGRGQSS
jgi:hypothetical protein